MDPIPGLKLISHNAAGVDNPDDPSYPFQLYGNFRPPEFMEFAFICLYGNEEIYVRGMTQEVLEQLIKANRLDTHPRLVRLTITKPEAPEAERHVLEIRPGSIQPK